MHPGAAGDDLGDFLEGFKKGFETVTSGVLDLVGGAARGASNALKGGEGGDSKGDAIGDPRASGTPRPFEDAQEKASDGTDGGASEKAVRACALFLPLSLGIYLLQHIFM